MVGRVWIDDVNRQVRIEAIRDRVAKILDADTRMVQMLRKHAFNPTPSERLQELVRTPEDQFPIEGFESRREVVCAIVARMNKMEVPAVIQEAMVRVNTYMKTMETEKAATNINLQILSIPGMSPKGVPALEVKEVKRMRRCSDGTLREITAVPDAIESDDPPGLSPMPVLVKPKKAGK